MGSRLREIMPHDRCGVVADRSVWDRHGETLREGLVSSDYEPVLATLEPGESSKSLGVVEEVHGAFFDAHLERRSPIVALGGGVAGDIAGFVAATHLRGVPFVQCPTTLLAMVDSSVGGKTGVNVPQGKNLLGAFHQPILVAADPLVLSTLPEREFRCGLAECIKHAVIRDPGLFEFMGGRMSEIKALSTDVLVELIRRNVEIKADVVMEDERESGVRAHLNLGHTYGHAIEACAGYGRVLHGEAVALGMVAAMRTAIEFGICPAHLEQELVELLEAAGLTSGPNPRLRLPEASPARHIYNQYTLRCEDGTTREALREFLAANSVASEIYYPLPLHLQGCFSSLGGEKGENGDGQGGASRSLRLTLFS